MLSDAFKQRSSRDIFHDEVNVLEVIVSFIVLDDVWVIERVQNGDLLHDAIDIVHQFIFVEHFYRYLKVRIVLIVSQEDTTKCACAQNLSFGIDLVVLPKFSDTLLFTALAHLNHLSFDRLDRLSFSFA